MEGFSAYKPVLAMIGLQSIFAGLNLITGVALSGGMSTRVFVVYGQAIAFLIMCCIAFFTRRNEKRESLGLKTLALIFVTSFIGITAYQNAYFEGLYLASSTIATAMSNLLPATTFIIATIAGLEKFNTGRLRNVAKVTGTFLCVGGAICLALVTGPVISNNTRFLGSKSVLDFGITLGGDYENLHLGCLLLFTSCCCLTFWVIMQVPISTRCPDLVYSTLWTCFFTTIQSSGVTLIIDHDLEAWYLHSLVEVCSCFYIGITTAVFVFAQTWCISQRGPVFVTMFNPLSTILTTIIATLFLNEKLYLGSLIGGFAVILGLYVVLWGKAKEMNNIEEIEGETDIQGLHYGKRNSIQLLIDESSSKISSAGFGTDLEESLLADRFVNRNQDEIMKTNN